MAPHTHLDVSAGRRVPHLRVVGGGGVVSQGDARQSDARQSDARQSDARQSDARQSDARQSDARQSDARQSDARQSDARQSDARQSDARQSDARQSDARGGEVWLCAPDLAQLAAVSDRVARIALNDGRFRKLSLTIREVPFKCPGGKRREVLLTSLPPDVQVRYWAQQGPSGLPVPLPAPSSPLPAPLPVTAHPLPAPLPVAPAEVPAPAARVRVPRPAVSRRPRQVEVAAVVLPTPPAQSVAVECLPNPIAPVVLTVGQLPARLDLRSDERTALAVWRSELITPILQAPRHSRERSMAAQSISLRRQRQPDGGEVTVSESTLYRWVGLFEQGGIPALMDKPRADLGMARTLVSTRWDRACPFDEATRQRIADDLTRFIRSLWASGAPSWRHAQQLATAHLVDECLKAGWKLPHAQMLAWCEVPRRRVEAERDYSLLAVKDLDAKAYFDNHEPRVLRERAGLRPMDIVIGDVHPLDIQLTRPDGTTGHARAIAWHDLATNRLWITLVQLTPREGIRREHIAASFASMASQWGLPGHLYLDNGSEYSWAEMMGAFARLAEMAHQMRVFTLEQAPEVRSAVGAARRYITRARPYNAPAKAIEGLFGVLEYGPLAMVPGWIGGDRMAKKTHNVGRLPRSFPGSWEEFHTAIDTALTYYHNTPQSGSLGDRSPREVYAAHIEAGWGKVAVDEQTLLMAFATEDTRVVDKGYVSWPGTTYYHDALLPLSGQRVTVRVAKHDPRLMFCFSPEGGFLCAATPAQRFAVLDSAGAKEQSRRSGLLRRVIAERKRDCDRLDLVEQQAAWNQLQPPMPDAPAAMAIEMTAEVTRMVEAARALPPPEKAGPKHTTLGDLLLGEDPEIAATRAQWAQSQ